MKALRLLTRVALPLVASACLFGQQAKGDLALNFQGSVIATETTVKTGGPMGDVTSNSTSGLIMAGVSYYFTDHLEAGLAPNIIFGDSKSTGVQVFANWNFLTNGAKVVPYAGLLGSYNKPDMGDALKFVGVKGGAKFFLKPKIAFDVNGNIMTQVGATAGMKTSQLQLLVGLSFLL